MAADRHAGHMHLDAQTFLTSHFYLLQLCSSCRHAPVIALSASIVGGLRKELCMMLNAICRIWERSHLPCRRTRRQ